MHLDEGTIHAWLDGALDAEEARRVERHAAECETCRAAVAEARGLIAGASRILSALDDVPSGVVPNSPAFGTSGRRTGGQRPRSLWNILHFTPTRAAAAAVVLAAAGTALVLRSSPNDRNQYETTRMVADSVRRSRPLSVPASPTPAAAAADSTSVGVTAKAADRAVGRVGAPARMPAPVVPAPQVAAGAMQPGRAGQPERKLDATSVAETQVATMADSASVRDQLRRDTIGRAFGAVSRKASAAAVAVGGAVPTAALPPVASKGLRTATLMAGLNLSGCYEIVGAIDSTLGLPQRLSLDTTRFESPAALAQRNAPAANVAPSERYVISALTSQGRRPVEHAYWQSVPGGARVTIEGPTPRTMRIAVRPDSISALAEVVVSSTPAENRERAVTLRRVSCPAQ